VARTFSSAVLQAMLSQEGGALVMVVLVTITHPTLITPENPAGALYFCSDARPFKSRGNTYQNFPFTMTVPDDDDQHLPQATLAIDNIDRSIYAAVRNMGTVPATILFDLVSSETPDTFEYSSGPLTMRDVKVDALTVTGTLGFEAILNEPFPGDLITPATIPGVFLEE
jgi:uncharacterized protein DUF1833